MAANEIGVDQTSISKPKAGEGVGGKRQRAAAESNRAESPAPVAGAASCLRRGLCPLPPI